MKRIYTLLVAALFTLSLIAPFTTGAAELPVQPQVNARPEGLSVYTVQPTKTLIGQTGSPKLQQEANWRQFAGWNPQVMETGRFKVKLDGRLEPKTFDEVLTFIGEKPIYFYWKPNETFYGLAELGFQVKDQTLTATKPAEVIASEVSTDNPGTPVYYNPLFWFVLLALALLGSWLLFKRKYMRPEQAGRPMVRDGLTDASAPAFIRRQVATGHNVAENDVVVHSITSGFGNGWAGIGFNGETDKPQLLRNRPCYEVVYNLANNPTVQRGYTLQGCANPIRFGRRPDLIPVGGSFQFTPNPIGSGVTLPTEWTPNPEPATKPLTTMTVYGDGTTEIAYGTMRLPITPNGEPVNFRAVPNGILVNSGNSVVAFVGGGLIVFPQADIEAATTALLPPATVNTQNGDNAITAEFVDVPAATDPPAKVTAALAANV